MLDESNTSGIFTPVQQERVSETIERQIKEAIIKRHYMPGDKLPPERELAVMFGSSRSSVREAIRSLERSGFVVIKKGAQGGAFVIKKGDSKPTVSHLRDMLRLREVSLEEVLQARLLIEPGVTAEAASRATKKDIEILEDITRAQEKAFNSRNPVIQYDRNPRFHSFIAEITGNQVFIIIMQILMEIHAFRMNRFKLDEKTMAKIVSQHRKIIEALKQRDRKIAFEEMKRHVLMVHKMHKKLEVETLEETVQNRKAKPELKKNA
ncbi:MAG: FadR family transcriptional regulator [Deltaproteobacteria bacterium]|nr:FadR family transcriptional regulator [Deltaproteobacteria bacterium]